MGRQLAETTPAARELFDRAAQVLEYDLAEVCFEGPAEKLNSTVYGQPALFVTSLAALESLRVESPDVVDSCGAVAGLSLGEYTAMVFAGVMDFEAGLRVVKRRGEAMQAAADVTPSGMASVLGLENDTISQLCEQARGKDEVLQIANYLCPANTVVSGHLSACQRLAPLADAAGAMKVIPLHVAGAFHTSLMDSAVPQLEEELAAATMADAVIPIYSNVDGRAHTLAEEMRDILVRQVVQPVRWEESMRNMIEDGFSEFYEIGPGRVLRGLLRRIDRQLSCTNVIG